MTRPALGSTEKALSHFHSERLPLGRNSEVHKGSVRDSAESVKPGLENYGLQALTVTPVPAKRGYQIARDAYTSPRSLCVKGVPHYGGRQRGASRQIEGMKELSLLGVVVHCFRA